MRCVKLIATVIGAAIGLASLINADGSNKLTNLTFIKTVGLPGRHRQVIKVSNADATRQIAMLNAIAYPLTDVSRTSVVVFGDAPFNAPEPIKAWVYTENRTGYEFICSHDEATALARQYHTSVLSKSGDAIVRVDDKGESTPQKKQ